MNSIIELKQAYVCGAFVGGAFVHAPYYLADAFSIIPNNYIYIYTYIHIFTRVGRWAGMRVCVCSIYKVKMSQA